MAKRRVVITGLGAITPLGLSVADSWSAILAGKSGVGRVEHFDVSAFSAQICATVKGFDASQYMPAKDARKNDVFVQYGLAATQEALQDAGLDLASEDPYRIGVAVGSGIGGLPMIEKAHETLLEHGPRKISPFFIPGAIINMVAGQISIHHGLKGPNISIVTACTTGCHNIGYAARTISYGDADVMVAGGAEMATSPLGLGGFCAVRALSTRNDEPAAASRPWDKDRDGFVLGDGAGVLILEELEHAKQRGATIYAELAGFGVSADGYHITTPDGKGGAVAMRHALQDAAMAADDVDYINAHATATAAGDVVEAQAVREVFAAHADQLAVSSTKSMTGHLLGAAGSVEAIFSVLAIRDNVAPPTINLDNPGEGCDLNFVPHTAQERTINVALSNSFGFGGTNGSILFKRYQ